VVLTLCAAFSAFSGQGPPKGAREEFRNFWGQFRSSVLAGDKEQVASLTLFPFKTRGMLDSDPTRLHDRRAFIEMFDKLVMQDTGLKKEPEPMRDLIQRIETPQRQTVHKQQAMERIGNFVFQRIDHEWRFVMAYLDEE
jgi:hypothetical protein